jgi:hypothetical protein
MLTISLVLFQVFAFHLLRTTNNRVLARNLFKQALSVMLWEFASFYMRFASTVWARYLHHGTFLKVFSYHLLILPSLLTVRALVLSPWALIYVFVQVFAEQLDNHAILAAFVRTWK